MAAEGLKNFKEVVQNKAFRINPKDRKNYWKEQIDDDVDDEPPEEIKSISNLIHITNGVKNEKIIVLVSRFTLVQFFKVFKTIFHLPQILI